MLNDGAVIVLNQTLKSEVFCGAEETKCRKSSRTSISGWVGGVR